MGAKGSVYFYWRHLDYTWRQCLWEKNSWPTTPYKYKCKMGNKKWRFLYLYMAHFMINLLVFYLHFKWSYLEIPNMFQKINKSYLEDMVFFRLYLAFIFESKCCLFQIFTNMSTFLLQFNRKPRDPALFWDQGQCQIRKFKGSFFLAVLYV